MLNKTYLPIVSAFCTSTVLLFASAVVHANNNSLNAQMHVFQIIDASKNIQKELKADDQVKPNSVLEYRVDYSNISSASLKNLKLNLPLPAQVSYLGQSFPANAYASTDGVTFAKAPLEKVVNGKKVKVPLSEYRVLQWNVSELKAKQKVSISARVKVNAPE
jgi:hypothetical protein